MADRMAISDLAGDVQCFWWGIAATISEPAHELATLEGLYEGHHRVAIGLAYRILKNRSDAEDTVQEAFLSVWRAIATFDSDIGSIRTWLLSIVRHRAIDVIRSRRRRPEVALEDHESPVDAGVVESVALAAVDREYALDLLARLNRPQREVLELAYFGGFSHREIAELLSLPVGTVKSRIRLALDNLRAATDCPAHPDAPPELRPAAVQLPGVPEWNAMTSQQPFAR